MPPTGRRPVSAKELLVLELLLREKEMYGLQLVDAAEGQLKRGTVYVTLGRMESKGYIGSRADTPPPGEGGLPRRLYAVTPLGRRVARAAQAAGKAFRVAFAK